MSATPEIPAEELVSVEVNGMPLKAKNGAMIIEVTDSAGIDVPRFCYHSKLPIAANCRMCLVEVEKAPKPLPACATPVAEGMKIFTHSDYARNAQKAVMEFLLINHPLDCPICDQGGECELQDLALGYGRDVSRFSEKKRVVKDKDIGPLIATDMTRCIHCTRCVRFLEVIAGQKELGGTGRGENVEIGTYVERAIESEMSGNVIDVCPVGALTSKPFRFRARAWELVQHASIAPHDSMGSNIFIHTRRGQVMRVVPRENEAINEVWLSDRDRFSYEALYRDDRATVPMVKYGDKWRETDWETALEAVVRGLNNVVEQSGADQLGFLVSPAATLEEMYLSGRLADGLDCRNIDHRLRQTDFTDQDDAPVFPWLGGSIEALEHSDALLLVGSDVREEQPIAAHRLRKASLAGAKIAVVNPADFGFHFEVLQQAISPLSKMKNDLAAIAASVAKSSAISVPDALKDLIGNARVESQHKAIADMLRDGRQTPVLLGSIAINHPEFSTLRSLAGFIASMTGATLGYLPEAANSTGGWIAGVVPHRGAAGKKDESTGLNAFQMFQNPRKAYVLFGMEPELDAATGSAALKAVTGAEFVVTMTQFVSDEMKAYADVILPVAPFTETSGTYVNAEGNWQSFSGAATPLGESRPGWKVLRVLGNRLGLEGFEYLSSEDVRDELNEQMTGVQPDNSVADYRVTESAPEAGEIDQAPAVHMYALDPLVRRAAALQKMMQVASKSGSGSANA